MSMAVVSWVATYLAYLRDLQRTYIGVIIYLLSSMDILAEASARGFHAAVYHATFCRIFDANEPMSLCWGTVFQPGAFTVSF